jgi:hypothetical protein
VEATFKNGKKYIGGAVIEPRHMLTTFSSNGVTKYTAVLWEDGTTSCNCPGWWSKKGKVRTCKHTARAAKLTATVDETTEYDVPTPAAGKSQQGTTSFKRRTRSVDT